jgi:hypothetical protein
LAVAATFSKVCGRSMSEEGFRLHEIWRPREHVAQISAEFG